MAIRYKALTELYQETQRKVTAPAEWQQFLTSACRRTTACLCPAPGRYRRPGDRAMEQAVRTLGEPGRKRNCRI